MKVLKKVGAFALAAIGAISGLITIAGAFGIQMTGLFGWVELNSVWILPISLHFCGMFIGWSIRNTQANV